MQAAFISWPVIGRNLTEILEGNLSPLFTGLPQTGSLLSSQGTGFLGNAYSKWGEQPHSRITVRIWGSKGLIDATLEI